MKQKWIVIADGTKAYIYAYQGPRRKLSPVEGGILRHINAPSRELVTTKRGRMPDNGPGQRSALERPTDPHEYEKYKFARKLSAFLEAHTDKYNNLIVVASPKVLGDIRQLLPEEIREKIAAELNKDLTNIPEPELPQHLQEVLNIEANPQHIPEEARYAKY